MRITVKGINWVIFLQTPIPLLTLVQTSLIRGAKLSLLSSNIPRNFVVGKWTKLIPLIEVAGKLPWESLENTVKNYFEILREKLLAWTHLTTLCNSVLILATRSERDLTFAYDVSVLVKKNELQIFRASIEVIHVKNEK